MQLKWQTWAWVLVPCSRACQSLHPAAHPHPQFCLLPQTWREGSELWHWCPSPPGLTPHPLGLFLPLQALYSSIKNEKLQWAM